ncbi:MAG: phosphotransferase [Clostridiales bacterium]|nr:phosphotransferase [Candidatus Crickella equi]
MENYREINLNEWHAVGEGAIATTYVSEDGETLLKLNKMTANEPMVLNEYNRSKNVASLGINTPAVYEVAKSGDKVGILFQNIKHKKSYSRLIADNPEKIEEYTKAFAAKCKELHATPCNTELFEGRADILRKAIDRAKFISKYKPELYKLVDGMADTTTCLHGDMQTGNLIDVDGTDYWIDFDKFSYGDPIIDIAHMYTIYVGMSWLFFIQNIVHMRKKLLNKFWYIFMKEYYGFNKEETDEFNKKLKIYNAIELLQKNYTHPGIYADSITLILARPKIKSYCKNER